jgi:hypothetical protein
MRLVSALCRSQREEDQIVVAFKRRASTIIRLDESMPPNSAGGHQPPVQIVLLMRLRALIRDGSTCTVRLT